MIRIYGEPTTEEALARLSRCTARAHADFLRGLAHAARRARRSAGERGDLSDGSHHVRPFSRRGQTGAVQGGIGGGDLRHSLGAQGTARVLFGKRRRGGLRDACPARRLPRGGRGAPHGGRADGGNAPRQAERPRAPPRRIRRISAREGPSRRERLSCAAARPARLARAGRDECHLFRLYVIYKTGT